MFNKITPVPENGICAFVHVEGNCDELGHALYVVSFNPNGTVTGFANVVIDDGGMGETELFGDYQ